MKCSRSKKDDIGEEGAGTGGIVEGTRTYTRGQDSADV